MHLPCLPGPCPLPPAVNVWPTHAPPFAPPCRRMTRREVVAVANTATLEAAVRGCMEDGATKVGGANRIEGPGREDLGQICAAGAGFTTVSTKLLLSACPAS